MRFLVLGCNGMAGHMISLYLKEKGYNVLGFDLHESAYVKSIVGDARNVAHIRKCVEEGNFDSVINCIGILNQFAEQDKEKAAFLNAYFPHYLADITSDIKTQVIHMSTDCVFSGDRGGYTEDDLKDGKSFYDRTKALGELDDHKNITLRNSIVGPDINPKGIGLFNWFMMQREEINGYTKTVWTGQTTLQLAKTMEIAAQEKAHGLYNTVPDFPITKYALLQLFNRHMLNDVVKIKAVDGINLDKSLKRTRYEFAYPIPDYETMVAEMAEWINRHRTMYPHYQR